MSIEFIIALVLIGGTVATLFYIAHRQEREEHKKGRR